MDFIEGLPRSLGYNCILVVVDRLSKYAHFIAISHPYTALKLVYMFLNNIVRLHGFPKTIVSDPNAAFSTAYHPQSDGQTGVVNKCLEQYLRCYVGDKPRMWSRWSSLAEWWYNTNHHSATKLTPYEAVYGMPPPNMVQYVSGTTMNEAVDETLKTRDKILALLKPNLL